MPIKTIGDGFAVYWSAACGAPPGERMAYAIRRQSDDRVIGMSTYYTGLLSQGGVEIGTSFLHPHARGGAANPETKLLMLDHAFDCGAVRVQFKVDTRSRRSQAAVAKLGPVRERVFPPARLTWPTHIPHTL